MKNRIRGKIGFVLVIAMLIVMIYPGTSGSAADESNGFYIEDGVIKDYVGAENAVTIPDGITAIGDYAFQGASITSIFIPASVTSIGAYAFANCTSLMSVSVPSSVASVGVGAFNGCVSLASVSWETNTGIPDNCFAECRGLTGVSISTGMTSIGSEAFKNCGSLPSIAIPAATGSIAANAFDGCTAMTAINVSEGNAYYMTYDGVLYTIGGVALLRCPQGKTGISIYENTQSIEANAFYGCKLGTVALPSSLTAVKLNAFTGSEIQTLVLTSSVSVFESQAFTIHCIQVPEAASVTPALKAEYGEIVITDGGELPPPSTEAPPTPTETEPTETKPTETTPRPTETTPRPTETKPTETTPRPTETTQRPTETTPTETTPYYPPSVNPTPTPEPGGNGGTGSGTGSGSGSSAKGSGGSASVKTGTTGIPYIAGQKDIQGWDKISTEMTASKNKETVHIIMNGVTIVPKSVLQIIHNKELTVVLDMGDGITWTLYGADITGEALKDTDFGVTLGYGNVPEALQKDVADGDASTQMHLECEGVFGFTALLKINLGRVSAGYNAALYYYNQPDNKMEYIDKQVVKSNGDVSFSFAHASDYVIVVEGLPESESDLILLSAVKDSTPKTGPGLNAKYILCLGVMLLGIYMMLSSKKAGNRRIA